MGNLLIRRREMVLASAPPPTPTPTKIYEISSPVSTSTYDTGLKLFETPMSFTILCEATFANRNWTNSQTIIGLGSSFNFGVGRCTSCYPTNEGVTSTTATNYYTGLRFNGSSDTVTKKASSFFSRFSDTSAQTRRFAVRYDHTTRKVEGFTPTVQAPTTKWWFLDTDLISTTTIKLNSNSAGSTVNVCEIWDGLLSDAEINAFVSGT